MIYTVRHRTTYAYEDEVTFARCVLRLTPRTSSTQTVMQSAIVVTPTPSRRFARPGPFGEETVSIVIETPHRELIIDARSRVEVHPAPSPLPFSAAWETVRARALEAPSLEADGPAGFLYPTARTPVVGAITDYARESFAPGRAIVEAASELMERIHGQFIYDGEATDVSTPPATAFAARRGVCQDFAHIMICGLRGLGLPAAYVSGYLRTLPPPGRPRLEGADATHAWVRVWCGEGRGWIGLDPTNAVMVQDQHIVLANGRDYADVAPIDGILLAPGDQALKVEVDVIAQDDPGRRREG